MFSAGQGKIPGHSGTDFKNRQPYFGQEMPYKKTERISRSRKPSEHTASAFKQDKYDRWVQIGFGLPMFLAFVFLAGFGIQYYARIIHDTFIGTDQNIPHRIHDAELLQKRNDSYQFLLAEGEAYLEIQDWDEAQRAFLAAFHFFEYGKQANIGLTKVLLQKCKYDKASCDWAADYTQFLVKMEYATASEIEAWKTN